MSLVAFLEVHRTAGNVCPVDLAPLLQYCGSIQLSAGGESLDVNVQPSVISVTPTLPTSTVRLQTYVPRLAAVPPLTWIMT